MIVKFHELDDSVDLKFAVIVAKDANGFVYVKHRDRDTWEIPGGHLEYGESPLGGAKRELVEETGALEFSISEVCNYSVSVGDSVTFGRLCFAEITKYAGSLDCEIAEVCSFTKIPENLTYPKIQPYLYNEVVTKQLENSEV